MTCIGRFYCVTTARVRAELPYEEGAALAEHYAAEVHLLAVASPMAGEFVIEAVMSEAVLAEHQRVAEEVLREGVDCLRQRRLTAKGTSCVW